MNGGTTVGETCCDVELTLRYNHSILSPMMLNAKQLEQYHFDIFF